MRVCALVKKEEKGHHSTAAPPSRSIGYWISVLISLSRFFLSVPLSYIWVFLWLHTSSVLLVLRSATFFLLLLMARTQEVHIPTYLLTVVRHNAVQ